MPIKITLELSDADLDYFRGVMRKAKQKASKRSEASILHAARQMARDLRKKKLSQFVEDRLYALDSLTRMLDDLEWKLEGADRSRVLQALAYFAEPADLIPDQIPGLGLLDDAIMVELVVQELRPELEAYEEFCSFREKQRAEHGPDAEVLKQKLEQRRHAMYGRIERRREQRERRGWSFSIFR
jgi:uncharacterized membrane protein YkvA (DUF1232 family)